MSARQTFGNVKLRHRLRNSLRLLDRMPELSKFLFGEIESHGSSHKVPLPAKALDRSGVKAELSMSERCLQFVVRARNGRYSVNGLLSDIPSSGVFRVLLAKWHYA